MKPPLAVYLEAKKCFRFNQSHVFLSLDKGDNLLSFEPPFVTTCYEAAPGYKYDAPLPDNPQVIEGMYMSWAMKYIITMDKQLKVTGFGLVFNQWCTEKSRASKSP